MMICVYRVKDFLMNMCRDKPWDCPHQFLKDDGVNKMQDDRSPISLFGFPFYSPITST